MSASKISVVIITLNEERNIGRALDSVKSLADEIIILDSGSTDQTENIAKQFDVRFVKVAWEGYAATKNIGHEKATHNYILSLDADESLSEGLQQEIIRAKKQGLNGYYEVKRLTHYCGHWIRYSGWYPDSKIRLFPKSTKWQGKFVHETLQLDPQLNITTFNNDMFHYSYYSTEEHRERADKYSRLTAEKMFEKGKKAGFLKPYLSAIARFFSMYILKLGFLDGSAGFTIAKISAQSNIYKYKTLRKLHHEQ
tara:strand:+ start:94 stop:852 length:759 start_codon:yes stop_codon:yes gene_type:complete